MESQEGRITVLSKSGCKYCVAALRLLKDEYRAEPVDVLKWEDMSEADQTKMKVDKPTLTFPRIYIGKTYVGGCSDLSAMSYVEVVDLMKKEGVTQSQVDVDAVEF